MTILRKLHLTLPPRRLLVAGLVITIAALGPYETPSGPGAGARAVELVRAASLHAEGLTGRGVTIAVVDQGGAPSPELLAAPDGRSRLLAVYDAIESAPAAARADAGGPAPHLNAMLSGVRGEGGGYQGVAPGADLVRVRALGPDGAGSRAAAVRAIDWVVAQRARYGIRVLNLALAAPAGAPYSDDPLGRAVMTAWQAGIVVVAPAGNGGPEPFSVAAPGNVPYTITVGAAGLSPADELVPAYSAAGPTVDGFSKPDLVAPGAPARGARSPRADPDAIWQPAGGTTFAAAVVSGVAALVLEADPWLTPDQVKHRLLAGARPAIDREGGPAYPRLRQGAGLVDARAAVRSASSAPANRGLDLARDLAGRDGAGAPERAGDLRPGGRDRDYLWSYGSGDAGDPPPSAYTWSDRRVAGQAVTWSDLEPEELAYTWQDLHAQQPEDGRSGDQPEESAYTWSDRR